MLENVKNMFGCDFFFTRQRERRQHEEGKPQANMMCVAVLRVFL